MCAVTREPGSAGGDSLARPLPADEAELLLLQLGDGPIMDSDPAALS